MSRLKRKPIPTPHSPPLSPPSMAGFSEPQSPKARRFFTDALRDADLYSLTPAQRAHRPETGKTPELAIRPDISQTPPPRLGPLTSLSSLRSPATPQLRPGILRGSVMDQYCIGKQIGQGAFASVYKATNRKTGQVLALKQLKLDDKKPQDTQSLMVEIDVLKTLKHRHIVKYHGFVKTRETLNIFLEYCELGSLRSMYKRRGPLSDSAARHYIREILLGLEYLHRQGVVHRDVKAANVLLARTAHGSVCAKLADFGVAVQTDSVLGTIRRARRANIALETLDDVAGTPHWMAPEVVMLEKATTACDVWSLGCTVIELLTAKPPFARLDNMCALHAIVSEPHPPFSVDEDDPEGYRVISGQARGFLLACFDKNPVTRSSAAELMRHPWLEDGGKGDGRDREVYRRAERESTGNYEGIVSPGSSESSGMIEFDATSESFRSSGSAGSAGSSGEKKGVKGKRNPGSTRDRRERNVSKVVGGPDITHFMENDIPIRAEHTEDRKAAGSLGKSTLNPRSAGYTDSTLSTVSKRDTRKAGKVGSPEMRCDMTSTEAAEAAEPPGILVSTKQSSGRRVLSNAGSQANRAASGGFLEKPSSLADRWLHSEPSEADDDVSDLIGDLDIRVLQRKMAQIAPAELPADLPTVEELRVSRRRPAKLDRQQLLLRFQERENEPLDADFAEGDFAF